MKHPGGLLHEGILVSPKVGQRIVAKPIELGLRIVAGYRETKLRQIAGITGKPALDKRYYLAGDGVWDHVGPLGNFALPSPTNAVIAVVIPFATAGLRAVQQHAVLATHVAIEILHSQLLATGSPLLELIVTRQKSAVFENLYGNSELSAPACHG